MFRSKAVSYLLGFGMMLVVMSIPVFMGLARPVFDMHNPYTLIYGVLSMPSTQLFTGLIAGTAQYFWDTPSVQQTDLISVLFSVAFWSLVGLFVGTFADLRYGRKS